MNKKVKIEEEVKKTLGMLDQQESLPPNPFFYTRIQQRIKEKSEGKFAFLGFLKPALLTGLVVINIGTYIWFFSDDQVDTLNNNQQELIELLSQDFNLEQSQTNLFLAE